MNKNKYAEEIEMKESAAEQQGGKIIQISKSELLSFLMDVLEIREDDVEKEEDLMLNNSYRVLWTLLEHRAYFTAVIEENYVDRVYRDSYYMHYSCKHLQYDRFCKRIFLFDHPVAEIERAIREYHTEFLQRYFMGGIVIRPLHRFKVGRTLLNPYYFTNIADTYIRYAKYNVTMAGIRLYVEAFPYSMQDGETTTCAEMTIINLLDYFSKKYPEYRYILPSEIADIALKNGFERALPSKGLRYTLMTKVLTETGFFPRLYMNESLKDPSQIKRIMHYYIESGIPVAVGLKVSDEIRHSVVCIGHGKIDYEALQKKQYGIYDNVTKEHIWIVDSSDLSNEYMVMDDMQAPYRSYKWETLQEENIFKNEEHRFGTYKPECVIVPLYKRMFLEAADAYAICTATLVAHTLRIKNYASELGTKENPIIIRIFMASSRSFKRSRIRNFSAVNGEIRERYVNTTFPRFVWVGELYDRESYVTGNAIGEIVVDATSATNVIEDSVILLQFPHYVMGSVTGADGKFTYEMQKLNDWEPFLGYNSNLHHPRITKNYENVEFHG